MANQHHRSCDIERVTLDCFPQDRSPRDGRIISVTQRCAIIGWMHDAESADTSSGVVFWEPPRLADGGVAVERTLDEGTLAADPRTQLVLWLNEAVAVGEPMPNAMALATSAIDGTPGARMVLLDRLDERGCAFQTNLESPKARHLSDNPRAALVLFWPRLLRQVRITGPVEQLRVEEVHRYFDATPAGIQAMLRACRQGQVIRNRAELEERYAEALTETGMPPYWGGFRVALETVEFWQGRANRLQDRLRFSRGQDGVWVVARLMP